MRTPARTTRRTSVTQSPAGKENHGPSQQESQTTPSPKKPRNRLSTAELARLEDVFRQDTHPTRQQKKDLAAELGMDYKTVTIWFQNKRQTAKRGQPPSERLERPRSDSCLRTVSSPSHNATLNASGLDPDPDHPTADTTESESPRDKSNAITANAITAKAIVKIKPLLNSLNALTSRSRGHAESMDARDATPIVKDVEPHSPQTSPGAPIASDEANRETVDQQQIKEKPIRWKRIRTLEWACERQAKRRKLSRDAYNRLGSEEAQDPNDMRMDSALSLLSLASSTQVGPPKDVMRGASLLLSFRHSWRRK